ncbi:MAG TPA: TraR/DksA C4-type zinc finger protein [Actinomycetes bacterium]|jgi:RNA polymerase-binding transcription factor DksA|nr:TraR/DksA C4-type zinc finger protein [Actinomycetes bacterium]
MATKKTQSTRTSSARSSPRAPAALAGKRITARDLRGFRQRLEQELEVLRGRRDGLEAASASSLEAAGAQGFGEEDADAGSSTFAREQDLSLVGNLRDLIQKIQVALARIDEGSYGRCEACDQPIEAERLDALPYTTLCLSDARRRTRVR